MTTGRKSGKAHTLSTEERNEISDNTYAFSEQRKEPLNDASHVRNAIARFDQVKDVTDQQREQAFKKIKSAAKKFGVEMTETSWHDLGKKPATAKTAAKKTARKTAGKTAKKVAKKTA